MTIRFGTVGSPSGTTRSGSDAAIKYIRELELSALEFGWVRSVRVKDETCERYKGIAETHDVSLSVHAPYYINLNSQTKEKMQASDERLLQAARKGYLAGAQDIIFHPGSYHEQPPEQVYERVKEKLIELTGILRDEGVDVNLRPETMGKGAMFGSLGEVVQLSKEVDGVEPCLDIAHLHARPGDGSFNSYDEFVGMFKLVKQELGNQGLQTMHFHISGIEYTQAGEQNHLMLADADLDWEAFVQALVDFDAAGVVVSESPTQEDDALKIKTRYEELTGGA